MGDHTPASTLKELAERLSRWESMPDDDLPSEESAIRAERFVEKSEDRGFFEMTIGLIAVRDAKGRGEPTGADWPSPDNLHARYSAISSRLRNATFAARVRGSVARRGGLGRKLKDPVSRAKADAKAGALLLWQERRAGKHPKLGTVEQFAIEVMRRWPVLKSAKVICGWSANWTKQVKAGKNPVC
jgi:hypothetical protein